MSPPPDTNMVCANCLVALDWRDDTQQWVHPDAQLRWTPGVAGHDPEPVPADNMPEHRYVCDFCFERDPAWSYPCDPFLLLTNEQQGVYHSTGAWAACNQCHQLIEQQDRNALVQRSMHAHETSVAPHLRDPFAIQLHIVYQKFFEARTGPATHTGTTT